MSVIRKGESSLASTCGIGKNCTAGSQASASTVARKACAGAATAQHIVDRWPQAVQGCCMSAEKTCCMHVCGRQQRVNMRCATSLSRCSQPAFGAGPHSGKDCSVP
jgi:hypothetical protein